MRVLIGPYQDDLIPVNRWKLRYECSRSDTSYLNEEDYTWYDKIIFGLLDNLEDLCHPINRWSYQRKRKVKVRMDYYDVWSADHTIALIIAPLLRKLKEVQHGYPNVDNEDLPEELRLTGIEQECDTDMLLQESRWSWVLDEMIWAFEQHATDDDDTHFHHNIDQLDMMFTPLGEDSKVKGASSLSFNYQKDPTKPPYWVDEEGKKKHYERKKNGLRLFAKYYESLWD